MKKNNSESVSIPASYTQHDLQPTFEWSRFWMPKTHNWGGGGGVSGGGSAVAAATKILPPPP